MPSPQIGTRELRSIDKASGHPRPSHWPCNAPETLQTNWQEMVEGLGVKMRESLVATDPETLLKTGMSGMGGGFEEMQKQFWSQFTGQNTKDSE